MITNQNMYQYTQLAEAAYANLWDGGKLSTLDADVRTALIASEMGEDSDGRDAQADQVVDNWSVITQYQDRGTILNSESGFGATLFQSKENGEYVLAMRGTAGGKDLIISDVMDIVHDGLAMDQIIDMTNFWNQMKANKGQAYEVATLVTDDELTIQYQYASESERAEMRREFLLNGYVIDAPLLTIRKVVFQSSDVIYSDERAYGLGIDVTQVTVTGHSLGGHLAAAFSRIFPNETKNVLMVNGAGFGNGLVEGLAGNGNNNIDSLFMSLNKLDHINMFDASKIVNITGSEAIDFIAQDWWLGLRQPGSQPEIFTEQILGNTLGHGSGQMTNTMAVKDLFFRIDQSLATGSFEDALSILRPLFEASDHDKTMKIEKLVEALAKLYLGDKAKPIEADDRPALYEQIALLQAQIPKGGSGKIESLVNTSVDDLIALSKGDIAYRYALVNLTPFIIKGLDYAQLNKNGELDLYDPTTGKGQLTPEYLEVRSALLASVIISNRLNDDHFQADNPNYIKDKESGRESTMHIPGLKGDAIYNQSIIFGLEEDDSEKNAIDVSDKGNRGSQNASVFAGAGDDTIIMGGIDGTDYVEGGIGFDTYDVRAGGKDHAIFDIDKEGIVKFNEKELGIGVQVNSNFWQDEDESSGSKTYYLRIGNDLSIRRTDNSGEVTEVTINHFFLQFKKVDGVISGLGVTLQDKGDPPTDEIEGFVTKAEGTISPLVLDFNGNGVSTTTLKDGVYFDLTNSGHAGKTAWVGRYDGVLALDINEDGTINHGGELFGNYTLLANGLRAPNGFEALRQYDQNKDGVIDAKDDIYSQLKVWFDTNFNGQSDKGELLSLIEAGVKSINLDYINSSLVDENGNDHKQQGSFTKLDGTVAKIDDVWFNYNYTDTKDTLKLEKTAEIAALIEIAGFGTVHDLQNLMMLDESGTLKALVIEITAALKQGQSFASLRDHIDELIFEWSGAAGYSVYSRGSATDGRMMYALEAFYGKKYLQGGYSTQPGPRASYELGKAFSILEQYVLDSFIYEITVRPLLDQVDFTWNETTQQMNADVSKLVTGLKTEFDRAPQEFIYVLNVLRNKLADHGDLGQQILQQIAQFSPGYTGVFEQLLTDMSTGLKINTPAFGSKTFHDLFLAKEGNDRIFMNPSMSKVHGYNGHDTIYASTNNSRMMGDYGSDTYVLFKGHGQDVIAEEGKTTDVDVLKFTDVNFHEVSVKRVGNDLVLFGYHGTDQITIENAYLGKQSGIETFIFADRTFTDQEIFLRAHLGSYFDLIRLNIQETGSYFDYTAVWQRFAEDFATQDPIETILKFKEFLNFNHLDADVSQGRALIKGYVSQITNTNVLVELGQAFLVNLGLTQFDDIIFANSKGGNIVQQSDQQPSTQLFLSGSGNDHFTNYNMTTSSTYRFSTGHGQDIIYDRSMDGTRISTIEFIDVEKSAVLFKRTLDDLVLYGYRGSDQISIQSYFNNNDYSINQILFSDQIFNLNIKDEWLDPFYNTTYTVSKDWYSFWENTGGRNALSEGKGDKWINDDRGTNDTIIFKGIYADGVRFSKSEEGNHLIISQNDKNLIIHNFFVGTQYRIETLIFEDKTLLLTDEVMATLFNDVYTVEKGFGHKDILDTNQGDDTLIFKGFNLGEMRFERSGNHLMIVGQQGTNAYGNTLYISNFYSNPDNRIETFIFDDKALSLKDGSMRLDNEWLTEFNNNIYTVKKGFGSQTIYDLNQGADTLIFKGYVASDVRIEREYDDLILITSDGRLRVTNFYYSNAYRIEKLQFDDQLIEVTDAWLAPFFDTTYILEKGFEFKLIQEDAGNDTIILKGFKKSDVLFDRERYYTYYDNLLIRTKDGDLLKIYNFYMNDKNRIETIVFDDQTVTLTDEWLKTANNTTYLLEKNVHDFSTIIADQAGEDQLIFKGYLADELTFKRSLTDYYTLEVTNSQGEILRIENFFYYTGRIESFVFDDRVIQTDYEWELSLENNQYHFAEGFGTQVINDYAGTDSITLAGISFVDATFKRSGEDLILSTLAGDSLTLSSFFSNTTYYGTSNFAFIQFDDQRFELTKDWIADFSNTTYLYDKNTGSFGGYIYDTKGDDTMIFKGYQSGELTFKRDANDPDSLMIINQQGEQIVIQSFFYTPLGIDVPPPNWGGEEMPPPPFGGGDEIAPPAPSNMDYQIERFVFDNQTISLAQILEKLNTPSEVVFSNQPVATSFSFTNTGVTIEQEVQSMINAMASFGAAEGSIHVEDQAYGYLTPITVPNY